MVAAAAAASCCCCALLLLLAVMAARSVAMRRISFWVSMRAFSSYSARCCGVSARHLLPTSLLICSKASEDLVSRRLLRNSLEKMLYADFLSRF